MATCEWCKDSEPCCSDGKCKGTDWCIHCGSELREVNGQMYHHSQFDVYGELLPESKDSPQYRD